MSGINYETMIQEAKKADLELLAEEMYDVFYKKHRELYSKIYEDMEFMNGTIPPRWEEIDGNLKQCWIAAAKYAMDEYIS